MIWDILDIIFRLFDLFPNSKKEEDAIEHFKKMR
jgi:hypothetical protein